MRTLWQHYSQQLNRFGSKDDDISPLDSVSQVTLAQQQQRTHGPRHQRVADEEPSEFAGMGNSSDEERAKQRRATPTVEEQWKLYTSLKPDYHVEDVYQWWWNKRHEWPQLAAMALDVLTTPPMSDEPERQFSSTGLMITDRRNRLKKETINVCSSLRSWTREGVISWKDFNIEVICAPMPAPTVAAATPLNGDDEAVATAMALLQASHA